LGSHWLNPKRTNVSPAELESRTQCHARLASFIDYYQVKPFKPEYRNFQALLRQGGSPNDVVKEFLRRFFRAYRGMIGDLYGQGHTFDHIELWGRDRIPLFLIGHPYDIRNDALSTLTALGQLGMDVHIWGRGWYGAGTVQVTVYHFATSERFRKESKITS
jgi:hypothetical protein